MHSKEFLKEYFSKRWCSSTSKYIYSGYAIVDKISDNESVIDVGCGRNPYKGHIKNLTGIDICDIGADIVTSIEDYQPIQLFDVALCLGSINFGTEDIISTQIEKVNSLLKPSARVYWRLNPGQHDHLNQNREQIEMCKQIDFFPWTFEKLNEYAKKYGFKQVNCAIDSNGNHNRLYAEWIREDLPENE